MNKQYLYDVVQCATHLGRHGMAPSDTHRILEVAKRLDTYNTVDCNDTLTDRQQTRKDNYIKQVNYIVSGYKGFGCRFSDDPRGLPIAITLPDGREIGIPVS